MIKIQLRRDSAANWTTANPILAQGEIGLELDTQKFKMGDGTTAWTTLGYYTAGASGVSSVTGTSPVVSSGGTTPAISLASGYGDTQNPYASKTANYVLASPNGTSGAPTFRALVGSDIPILNQNTTGTASNVTGTVAIANGGTGATTAAGALTNLGAYAASNPSGYITSSGTAANVSGIVAIANGGSGQTTAQTAMNAFAGAVTSGSYLRGNGTNVVMSTIQAADVPTLNQNTTGSAAKWTTARILAGNSVDGSADVAFSNKFIAQGTTDTGLSGAQFLGSLATGIVKNTTTTGVLSIATAGTDYAPATSGTSILKGNGTGGFSSATSGTDYAPATSGSSILYGNGSGGFSNVTIGTGLSFLAGTLANTVSMVYPGAGIAVSTGSAWSTSLTAPSGTIVGTTDAQTVTNKRIDPRVTSTTSASSLTPDVSAADIYAYTALAANLTINAPIGTPVDGDKLIFRLLDNGTSRTLTWNATYTVIGVTLPTSTTASKMTYVGCIYNAANTRWDVIAVTTQA
jgi:hypothetical protein